MKIGHPKTFWGGVMFLAIGALFAIIARGVPGVPFLPGYAMGTPARMGPAFFPFWLGVILVVLGIIIIIEGIRTEGKGEDARFPKFHWRPVILVLGAVCLFGVILKAVGMLLAGIILILIASLGSHDFKLRNTLILAVGLVIFCALVFVEGLKLPIPLCPDIESLQNAVKLCRA